MSEHDLELKLNKEFRLIMIRKAFERLYEEIRTEQSVNDVNELDFNDSLDC